MQIRLSKLFASALAAVAVSCAHAHNEVDEAIPETPSGRAHLAMAFASFSASNPLPSQALPGYLLLGDAGIDRRGLSLEHAVAQLGYRFNSSLGAELSLGAHGSDPVHIEAAWMQARGQLASTNWTLGAGRNGPSMGFVLKRAGHLDRFSSMPLAKLALTNGNWIDDGAELRLRRALGGIDWTMDLGLWRGRTFPGSPNSRITPSIHFGTQGHGLLGGIWSLGTFWARFKPLERGSRMVSTSGAHSHTAPSCDDASTQVVCFGGRSRISGISAQWEGHDLPITLSGAVTRRDEQGTLQSNNGTGQYDANSRGSWLEVSWRIRDPWQLGLRFEQLSAQHKLIGPGAALVADEAGLVLYSPQRRTTAVLDYTINSSANFSIEGGRETTTAKASSFVALRLLLQWNRDFPR